MELGFGSTTSEQTRGEFIAAVEDHLRFEGVEVTFGRGFACNCGDYSFSDQTVLARLDRGLHEIECPVCGQKHPIFLHSPRERGEEKRPQPRSQTAPMPSSRPASTESYQILHLSDLHFLEGDDPNTVIQPLLTDLRQFLPIDYLVVSGDLADKANPKGFEYAEKFLASLLGELHLTSERVILTPGNHDVDESVEVHAFVPKRRLDAALAKGAVPTGGDVYRYQLTDKYPQRFERYRAVHHRITGADYPIEAGMQCLCRPYEIGLQFLTLNSAWKVDEYNRGRIGLNPSARENGIEQTRQAATRARFAKGQKVLRIAVWHHAVSGDRKIPDEDLVYLERLADEGFALVLHGDVHEVRAGVENPFSRDIYIAGAGSLHSGAGGRPESTPCLYNVLEVQRDLARIRGTCPLPGQGGRPL